MIVTETKKQDGKTVIQQREAEGAELQYMQLIQTSLSADKTTIAADGVDAATITITSALETVPVTIDGVVYDVQNGIIVSSIEPGVIVIAVKSGGTAYLEIIAEEIT